MRKFEIGTRVVVIDGDNHEIREGEITSLYSSINIAIVKFDDGETEKVNFDYLGFAPEKKYEESKAEPKEEPVVKSEITITPGEFSKIASSIATEMVIRHGSHNIILCADFCASLHQALFFDETI